MDLKKLKIGHSVILGKPSSIFFYPTKYSAGKHLDIEDYQGKGSHDDKVYTHGINVDYDEWLIYTKYTITSDRVYDNSLDKNVFKREMPAIKKSLNAKELQGYIDETVATTVFPDWGREMDEHVYTDKPILLQTQD